MQASLKIYIDFCKRFSPKKSIFFKKKSYFRAKQSGGGFFSDWLTLEGVSRGEVLLSAEWREAVPVGDRDECEFESFILSVFVDSCRKLVRRNY